MFLLFKPVAFFCSSVWIHVDVYIPTFAIWKQESWKAEVYKSAGISNPWVKIELKVPELAHDVVEYLRLTSYFMTCSTVWVRVRNHRFLPYSLSPRTPRNYSTWIYTKMLQVGEGTMKWPEKKQEKDLQFTPKKCYCNCFHFSPASCEPHAVRPEDLWETPQVKFSAGNHLTEEWQESILGSRLFRFVLFQEKCGSVCVCVFVFSQV